MARVTDNALWYLGRGAGVSALVLFTVTTALGLLVAAGRPLPGLPRFAVTSWHRSASLSALVFLLLHMVTLLTDPYAQLRLFDLVVPFAGRFRPLWQGLGTVAFDLVVVLVVTSLLRQRIGLRLWRTLHWAAYVMWPVAVLHVLGNGTDRRSTWLEAIVALCIATVVAAGVVRVAARRPRSVPVPPVGLGGLR